VVFAVYYRGQTGKNPANWSAILPDALFVIIYLFGMIILDNNLSLPGVWISSREVSIFATQMQIEW
jgi:hypothetical protein